VTTEELENARGRTKKNKFRILTHKPPDKGKLKTAVEEGIRDCVQLFTQPPPKGSKHNFGFLAYEKWVNMLGKSNDKGSWNKLFPPGKAMYSGLTSVFSDICIFGKEGGGERETYAQFLNEAAILLANPDLNDVAEVFRNSAEAWNDLANTVLADEIILVKDVKDLMLKRHQVFLDKGKSGLEEIHEIDGKLEAIKSQVNEAFPLDSSGSDELKGSIAEKVLAIRDIEFDAIQELQAAVG
jgi:hypothetical protein